MDPSSFKIPRHWWGKIIGGLLGVMKGGISGAVIGIFLGHFVDRMIFGLMGKEKTRRLFFTALFACLGRVSKADGRVTEAEIASAESLMRRLELDEQERRMAIEAFNLGKAADFDLEGELQEFISFTRPRTDLRQMFMEVLLEGAAIDGRISVPEQEVLVRVARTIQIPPAIFQAMYNAFAARHGSGSAPGAAPSAASLDNDFAALGLTREATDQQIKRAYRKLVSQYHPDRLVSQGLPEEMMEQAKVRVRDINLAYDRIKNARGIK